VQALLAGAGEASAPAHAPYLHPCRQSLHSSDKLDLAGFKNLPGLGIVAMLFAKVISCPFLSN